MNSRFKSSISLGLQYSTFDSWYSNNKTNLQEASELKSKLYPNEPKAKFQEYKNKIKISLKSKDSQISSHSLLGRFHSEFQKTVSSTIAKEQKKISKRMLSINPEKRKSLNIVLKSWKQNLPTPNIFPNIAVTKMKKKEPKDESTSSDNSYFKSSKSTTLYNPLSTFTEPNSIVSKARIRSYDIKFNKKWKDKIGLYSQEIKFSPVVLKDLGFQSNYIKDEITILLENFQYYKQTYLSSSEILKAFKNKDIRFQISHNKTFEETISFLQLIPKLILRDYNQYTDSFIAIENIPKSSYKKVYITNEANCFVYNAQLLNKLILFVKCCLDVYLNISKQVDNFVIKIEDFNYLQGILQKTRFNISVIISETQACLKDLKFEKEIIQKFQPIITLSPKKTVISKNKIEKIIHNQFQFGRNDQSQKMKRMNKVLSKTVGEDDTRKSRIKLKNGHDIIPGPMELIVS